MQYPIAEIFHSVQGEGRWTGTPMMFVRLAGCNVGRYSSVEFRDPLVPTKELAVLHSICTTLDGQRFLCDTDYHTYKKMTTEEIVAELAGEDHVCITGGEPFMHDLTSLCESLPVNWLHFETSGTKPIKLPDSQTTLYWVTCCPKFVEGGLDDSIWDFADEWKLLVGPQFNEEVVKQLEARSQTEELYLQPINGVNDIWRENLDLCLSLLTRHPHWKLSAQLHKFLEVR